VVVVTIFAAIVTAWLLGVIEPPIPAGDWHAFPSRLFVSVGWPSLTWSLRRLAGRPLADLFSVFWW